MEDSSREKRFQQDKEQLLSCCSSYKFVTVKTLRETSLSLEFVSGEKRVEYSILYTPDYPDNTVVTNTQDQADVKCYTKPLVDIFIDICKEWCKIHEILMTSEQTDTTLTDSNTILTPPHSVADNTHQLLTSQMSDASSIASSEITEESDYEDYFDDYEDVVEEDIVSPLLEKDIEIMERLYGKSSVESRIFAGINEIDILMYIDMGFLDVHTASAWGVDVEVPVVLQVHFHSARKYLDGPEPKIEVYQGSPNSKEKRKFGLGAQIQKIVETFVSNQWKSTSNYHLEQCSEGVSEAVTHETATTPTNTPPSTSQGHPRSLQTLVDMGFPLLSAQQALEICGQEVQKAVHLLTTGELLDDNEVKETHNFFTKKTKLKDSPQGSPPAKLRRLDSQEARAGLVLDNSIEHVKQPPSLENGYLAQVMKYALNRIPSLSEFCVICDERHVMETGLLRPCVCTRELCVFAFQKLGVMDDAAESVAADANVVEIMIAMCNAASTSSRSSILDPYPSIVDPVNPHGLAMDPAVR